MYEGPIKAAHVAGNDESPILRQLRWTDLVARLAATREQRTGSCDAADELNASFAAFHLAAGEEGQHTVNRDALRHGKLSRIFTSDAAKNVGEGDRETR